MSKRSPFRRGYVFMPALLAFGVAGLYALVLARYGMSDLTAVRRETLEACVEQAAQSARAWAAMNAAQLDRPRELPITELLAPGGSGSVTVERGADESGNAIVICRIQLATGARRVDLTLESPLILTEQPPAPDDPGYVNTP